MLQYQQRHKHYTRVYSIQYTLYIILYSVYFIMYTLVYIS